MKSKRASEATPSMADNVPNNGAASCPLSQAVTRADLHEFQEAMFAKLSALIAGQLQSAIEAILKPAIDAAMGPITSVLDGIGVAVEAQGRQISDLELGLSDYSDRAVALELAVTRLSSECRQMADKIDDLESRPRRCNLRVVGVPERLEGVDPVAFMSGFFTEVLGDSLAPSPMKLNRAHRLGPNPTPGSAAKSGLRVMIVKFHNFRDKESNTPEACEGTTSLSWKENSHFPRLHVCRGQETSSVCRRETYSPREENPVLSVLPGYPARRPQR
ncbi:hypothetical protein DPEC_G00072020 [Dallia pectoralis]|uniref:Uncharacterized protein n=1 Tax=Dallia pectoralis TaxID=75939 RepID=A0ACC2H295_DALPE|nr:hypothetical protein DPEC_G00072020 [Dallia pectoralis]